MEKILNLVDIGKSDIKYQISKFPDGQQNINLHREIYAHVIENEDQYSSIIIKSRLNNWLDLELITCAVACLRQFATDINLNINIHLYTPYIMGARSDRKFEAGGNNYLKDVICPIINSLNFKTVTCIDPHSDVLEACIKGFRKESNYNLVQWSLDNIAEKYDRFMTSDDFILVSPDAGASKKIYKLAEKIGYKGDIITCSKDRDNDGKLTKTNVPMSIDYWNTKDKIIIDDICDGGATFINIAKEFKKQAYQQKNKSKIYLIVTHGIFSKGFGHLSMYFDGIYCTNSYQDVPYGDYNDETTCKEEFVKQLKIF